MKIYPSEAALQSVVLQERNGKLVHEGYILAEPSPADVITWNGDIYRHFIANVYRKCLVSPLLESGAVERAPGLQPRL